MFFDGYKYWLAYTKNDTSYYRCARHNSSGRHKCPGRCVRQRNGTMRNTHSHSHGPDNDRLLVDAFRTALTQRASREPQAELHTIYWEEASQRHLDAAMLYGFGLAESAMRKARLRRQQRQQLQPVFEPTNAMEVDAVLAAGGGARALRVGGQQSAAGGSGGRREAAGGDDGNGVLDSSFYRCTLKMADGASCWVFAHGNTLRRLKVVEQLHVDASMVDVIAGHSMMVFHAVRSEGSTPIVYAVFATQSPAAAVYASVFAYVREHFATHIRPTQLVTNYDTIMQKTAAYTYPDATVKGFWHEYTGALLARIRHQLPELQTETASGHGCSCLRMLLVLPLLPADYMQPGLEAVRKWATDKRLLSAAMQELCSYVAVHWLRPMGAGKISMFGVPNAVHSHAQHFVKELRDLMGGMAGCGTVGVWQLLKIVAQMATRAWAVLRRRDRLQLHRSRGNAATAAGDSAATSTALTSAQASATSSAALKAKDAVADGSAGPAGCNRIEKHRGTIITDATEQWIRTPVHLRNPLQFLQLSSHCANDLLYTAGLEASAAQRERTAGQRAAAAAASSHDVGNIMAVASMAQLPPPSQAPTSSSSLSACAEHLQDTIVDVSACSFDQLLQNDHNYFFDTTPDETDGDASASAASAGIMYHHEPFQIIPPSAATSSSSSSVVNHQSVFELCSDVTHLFGTSNHDDAADDDDVDMLTAAVQQFNYADTGTTSCAAVATPVVQQAHSTCQQQQLLQLLPPPQPAPPPLVTTTVSSNISGEKARRVPPSTATFAMHHTDPPPLKFFKAKTERRRVMATTVGGMSGPPPLVPIVRRVVGSVIKRKAANS